jgi:uncharacterized phiE125 gp8 family phage protein
MSEPVSLAEARAQVNIVDAGDTSFDTFLSSLLAPARAYVERVSRRLFVAGERTETFRAWGDYLEIWRSPITSIDSIAYSTSADPDDDADYSGFVANLGFPARIYPAIDGSGFPDLIAGGTITVTYTGGAVEAASEEYLIGKRAMLLLIGHWFEFREAAAAGIVSDEIAATITWLLDELRPVSAY